MAVDSQQFKNVMAKWASGVTVVTTVHEGAWKGTTASSFSSVSLNPPTILVCLAQKLYTHKLFSESGVFAVNILSPAQLEVAKLFAGMYPDIEDRFAENSWQTAQTGSPILEDGYGWLDCKIAQMVPAGDHTIFVGEVQSLGTFEGDDNPLMYFNRHWGTFTALE